MPEKPDHEHHGEPSRGSTSVDAKKPRESTSTRGDRASTGRRSLTADPDRVTGPKVPSELSSPWQEPRGVQENIADADKVARTGSKEEPLRNTPPAGAWNETSHD